MKPTRPLWRRLLVLLALTMAMAALAVPVNAAPAGTQASCSTTWGSTAKNSQVLKYTSAPITNLRAGRHECFDRLVIDLRPRATNRSGQATGYRFRNVDEIVESGRGNKVKIAGGAYLMISVNAAAHDENGRPTYTPKDRSRRERRWLLDLPSGGVPRHLRRADRCRPRRPGPSPDAGADPGRPRKRIADGDRRRPPLVVVGGEPWRGVAPGAAPRRCPSPGARAGSLTLPPETVTIMGR